MKNNISYEIAFSIEKAKYLLLTNIPKDKWECQVDMLSMIEIALEDLTQRKVLSQRKANTLRKRALPLSYVVAVNSPYLEDKEEIKKRLKIEILNNNLSRIGLSKGISIVDC